MIYLIGSLRSQRVPEVAQDLRTLGYHVFDDWYAVGPEADDYWRTYEKNKGNSFLAGLQGAAAENVYNFDKRHLDASDVAVLVAPAGKSAHLELGYMIGAGKRGYIFLPPQDEEPERWDIMYKFATGITASFEELVCLLGSVESC